MRAVNCPRCGKLFHKIIANVCPACEKAEEEIFQKLYDFLRDNPDANLARVSEETDISAKRILHYIREGRLEITSGMSGELSCAKCDKPIKAGNYCKSCAQELTSEIKQEKKRGSGMHTRR